MDDRYHIPIPPVFTEPEGIEPPSPSDFRKTPAEKIRQGDLVIFDGEVWRVKERRTFKRSIKIRFTLWNIEGGRPQLEYFLPREWIPVVRGRQPNE